MKARTRKAYLRFMDTAGVRWKVTWDPARGVLVGRSHRARKTLTVTANQLSGLLQREGAVSVPEAQAVFRF